MCNQNFEVSFSYSYKYLGDNVLAVLLRLWRQNSKIERPGFSHRMDFESLNWALNFLLGWELLTFKGNFGLELFLQQWKITMLFFHYQSTFLKSVCIVFWSGDCSFIKLVVFFKLTRSSIFLQSWITNNNKTEIKQVVMSTFGGAYLLHSNFQISLTYWSNGISLNSNLTFNSLENRVLNVAKLKRWNPGLPPDWNRVVSYVGICSHVSKTR